MCWIVSSSCGFGRFYTVGESEMNSHKVLVVGGAGYIGSHMVKELLGAGYGVITLDDLSKGHRDLLPGGEFVKGSLADARTLDRIFTDNTIAAVMHFAAYSLVGESVVKPLEYYRNNTAGTMELLAAMVRHEVKRFIFSSTAAVYGEPESVPITEDHPSRPTNPYGASKIAVERMLHDCDAAYGLKYTALRYFNAAGADESGTIGERHDPETHLIPLILKVATGERDEVTIFGTDYATPDGTCLRDYVHVTDLAQAHLLALEALLDGSESAVYNLGNSKGNSVREVIELAEKATGRTIPVVEAERRPGDPAVLVAASDAIRKDLGWKPRYEDLETIIRTAWAWHSKEAENSRLDCPVKS
jgi:UDP-glucose 4-epimerase